MNFLSVCSGIDAASVAWAPFGWHPVAFSEIERFPSEVLAHHYPNTPNWGDMEAFHDWPDADVDLLIGGTPCQSFSVAGLRAGLDDPRGNLALTYLAIAERYRPKWVVWENVPGVLSSNAGRDFGAFLGGLGKLGYGFAYRVLDAQYVRVDGYERAVPQRRRRVFVVGCAGDWRSAAAVLFDSESLRRNPPPRREAGQGAPTLSARSTAGGGLGTDFDLDGGLQFASTITSGAPNGTAAHGSRSGHAKESNLIPVSKTLNAGSMGRRDWETEKLIPQTSHALTAEGFDASEDGTGRGTPLIPFAQNQRDEVRRMSVSGALSAQPGVKQQTYVAQAYDLRGREGGAVPEGPHNTANIRASSGGSSRSYVATPMTVRRLTPTECERLQGFPEIEEDLDVWVSATHQEQKRLQRAVRAASHLSTDHIAPDPPVLAHVLIDSERRAVEIRNAEKSTTFANSAVESGESRLCTLLVDSALALAGTLPTLESGTQPGSEALPASISAFTRRLNGGMPAVVCGLGIEAAVSDVESALTEATKSTTSRHFQYPGNCDWWMQTLSSCVAHATCGFTPEITQTASSFAIRLKVRRGYTAIPRKGKPAADGPRYKALGNSMAVNVIRWIGRRIELVNEIRNQEKT